MLRRHHRFFQSLQVIRDLLLVWGAFYVAYWVRFSFPDLLAFDSVSDPSETLIIGLMAVGVWAVVAWFGGLYVSRRARSMSSEIFDVSRISVVAFLTLTTITYFVREARYSRGTLLLWATSCVVFVSLARIIFKYALRRLRASGFNLRHVVVIGSGDMATRVVQAVRNQNNLGLRVIGVVCPDADYQEKPSFPGAALLGPVSRLHDILAKRSVDQVIVALPLHKLDALADIMKRLSQETVDVRLVPDFYEYMTLCGSVEEFAGMPIINLQATPLLGWNMVAKRVFDMVVATGCLILASPLMLLTGAMVYLADRGPVLFVQERVGLDGRRFRMFKFRTMRSDAERAGAQMTSPRDPRRTLLGVWLRRLSLDELPQLWNVLRGDMSLVGPRPEQPRFIEDFKKEIPRYALRHKIKAGMTGWAQIHGMRGNTSIEKRIEFDLYYIENWSLLLDIKILLRTMFGGFLSPNAY